MKYKPPKLEKCPECASKNIKTDTFSCAAANCDDNPHSIRRTCLDCGYKEGYQDGQYP